MWRRATQVVVNVGGASPPGYGLAYQTLLGEPLLSAPDGSSFVTHWMVRAIITAESLHDLYIVCRRVHQQYLTENAAQSIKLHIIIMVWLKCIPS